MSDKLNLQSAATRMSVEAMAKENRNDGKKKKKQTEPIQVLTQHSKDPLLWKHITVHFKEEEQTKQNKTRPRGQRCELQR